MKKLGFALCLAGVVSLAGCATAPDMTTAVRTEGGVPAGTRLVAPLIVADDGSIELQGPELTPEARANFEKERAARIALRSDVQVPSGGGHAAGACVYVGLKIPLLLPLAVACPIAVVGVLVTAHVAAGVQRGVNHAIASAEEPSLQLSSTQAERVAMALREQATGAALVERALYTAPADFADASEAKSRLVVRMKAAQTCEVENALAICLVAEARAFAGNGAAPTPTEHVFVHGPLMPLAAENDGHLERAIDQALDLLAESIVFAYTGSGPAPDAPPAQAPAARRPAVVAPKFGEPQMLAERRKFTDEEASVFPKTSAGVCVREGC